jgi:hypothetical protein
MKAARAAAVLTWVYAAGWHGRKAGAVVNLALIPVEAIFWVGFALPLPWLNGIARAGLLAAAWKSLAEGQSSEASEERAVAPLAGA